MNEQDKIAQILDKIQFIAEEMAFLPTGTSREEKLKSIIILCFTIIKADKTDQLFTLLMQLNQKNGKN